MNGGMRAALLTRVAALSLSVSACCRCEAPGPPEPADSASTAPHGFNASPRIDAVYATLDGVRLRVVPPGSTVRLERFGLPERFSLSGVLFSDGGATYQDQGGADPVRFALDTGTTPTIIGDAAAGALGLLQGTGTGACLGGTSNLYEIDAVTMTGAGGAYRVENAVLCWDEPSLQGPYQAVIGSNLFDQVSVVFDGVQNTLGIVSSGS